MGNEKVFLKPLTDWEVGQELIKAQDEILECAMDIEKDRPAHVILRKAALDIGDYFELFHNGKSHTFGILSRKTYNHSSEG